MPSSSKSSNSDWSIESTDESKKTNDHSKIKEDFNNVELNKKSLEPCSSDQTTKSTLNEFEDLKISKETIDGLNRLEINKPNDLQASILPVLISNRHKNIFIKSRPNSGKKIAFLIDLIERIDSKNDRVQCIILEPTIELCVSTSGLCKEIGEFKEIKVDYATHEESIGDLRAHCIVCNIEMFAKFLNEFEDINKMRSIECIILDELELSINSEDNREKLEKILEKIQHKVHQFQIYSNSFDDDSFVFMKKILKKYSYDDLIFQNELKSSCLNNFIHFYCLVDDKKKKYKALVQILRNTVLDGIVIFINNHDSAVAVARMLKEDGFENIILCTLKSTVQERLIANNNFNGNRNQILILTYPILHGLKFIELSIVINFDLLLSTIKYFHQITKCINLNEKPNFIVNLVDDRSKRHATRHEKKLNFKMIRLSLES